ncbi:MAG: CoB--CoM heterodisulfide reductase iron-sulfur subunit A family protein [bacterium]|nr:CoB--CoM heterodisulfide reductase iron-sulfur subunit A family protein [bacterium]
MKDQHVHHFEHTDVKVGVYVCHCGINIASKVNVHEVVEFAKNLPNVTVATEYKFMCSDAGQDIIVQDIRSGKVNRVIVASCSPLMHEITFRNATQHGGINPYFFQMANIREHVSWVTAEKEDATVKAKALVAAAVHRVSKHTSLEKKYFPVNPNVLVVGGGIAGIQAALTIANAGKKVYLVEREPTIGGHMAKFDKTFPTLDCAACILTPKMSQVRSHPNITLWTYAEVENVSGYVGNFTVQVKHKKRYINADTCIGCKACVDACIGPENIPDEFNEGLSYRKPVYMPFPQATPSVVIIDENSCYHFTKGGCPPDFSSKNGHLSPQLQSLLRRANECFELRDFQETLKLTKEILKSSPEHQETLFLHAQTLYQLGMINEATEVMRNVMVKERCVAACPKGSVDLYQTEAISEIQVGAIIIATGFKTFQGERTTQYGYKRYPNVFTSLEIERLVNASGPTGGEIVLRDGKTKPKSVAILHCVGSRDLHSNRYCSRVCCMYSLKLAHLIKERTGAEVYNFYIDMRTPGKGYEEFYEKLCHENVHFIRGRAAEVTDWVLSKAELGKLVVRAEDTLLGMVRRVPVDMVVLSVGLEPQTDAEEVRRKFNISCSKEGWFLERHPKLAPVNTFTDGIFLAGACQGPKDIPDTVAQAGAAAAEALALIDIGYVEMEPNTAFITEENCSGCRICVALCPYTAITTDPVKLISVVNPALCKGCGTCVAACPSGAAQQNLFTDEQIFEEIEGVLEYV